MLGAATVIVDDRHRVLLVKHAYGERNWELPGGRGEARESVEVTARREAPARLAAIEKPTRTEWAANSYARGPSRSSD